MAEGNKWQPTAAQLGTPSDIERAFRQVLKELRETSGKVDGMAAAASAKPAAPAAADASGPATTKICGLNVEPVTEALANGATLKYNKGRGTFSFQ